MPDIAGTTTNSEGYVISVRSFSSPIIEIYFTGNLLALPLRVGYGFVIGSNTANPKYRRVLWKGDMQLPGTRIVFDESLGFETVHYGLFVRWNKANYAYIARFA